MNDNLTKLLNEAVSLGEGSNDISLSSFGDGEWTCEIIPVNSWCRIGEVPGKYKGSGSTQIEAVMTLIKNFNAGIEND
jgi:hypothetical protein